jgi:glycosyltransferase involved in cell wall biosynthesis
LPVVLFAGFFSHEKRPDALYRAWGTLWESGVRSTLVLIGATRSAYYEIDAAMSDRIQADAMRRGLSTHLVFVERTPEIEKYYRAADIFVLPTTREGLPNVLLEAMASGVPPVISQLAGVTDWIVEDGVTGRLVPPGDDEALTAALRDLLIDADARRRIGSAARSYVERHFAPRETAARTLGIYRQLLPTRRS